MSMKPRAAIMLAGHAGDAVIWYTPEGGPTTSTAYASKPIPFVARFAQMNPTKEELTGEWTRMLPASSYEHEDDGPGEHPPEGWKTTFPHALEGTRSDGRQVSYWQNTPNADAWLARLAREAVDDLKLGRTQLDYLAISFSTLDTSGHGFGPDSHEVQDVLLRLDRTIGDLLDFLDDRIGKGRYVLALTGDHGVAPLPERRRAEHLDAGRIDLKTMATSIDAALSERWGKATYIGKVVYTDIYFEKGAYERLEKDAAAMKAVTDIVRKTEGVSTVYRKDQVLAADARGDDEALTALRLSYVPDRGGDLILVPRPYWMLTAGDGTTHGTPHPYDRQVPADLLRLRRQTGPICRPGVAGRHRADAGRDRRRQDAEDRRQGAEGRARRAGVRGRHPVRRRQRRQNRRRRPPPTIAPPASTSPSEKSPWSTRSGRCRRRRCSS